MEKKYSKVVWGERTVKAQPPVLFCAFFDVINGLLEIYYRPKFVDDRSLHYKELTAVRLVNIYGQGKLIIVSKGLFAS